MWVGMSAGAAGVVTFDQGRVVDTVLAGTATSFLSLLADAILLRLLGDPRDPSDDSEGD